MLLNKKKTKVKKSAIILFLIMIALGGILYVYMKFSANLPKDSGIALEQVIGKMDKMSTFHAEVERTAQGIGMFSSEHYFKLVTVGDFVNPGSFHYVIKAEGTPEVLAEYKGPLVQEIFFIDNKYYVKDDKSGDEWREYDSSYQLVSQFSPKDLIKYAVDKGQVSERKSENMDGNEVEVFTISFSGELIAETAKPLSFMTANFPEGAKAAATIWVDKSSKLPLKQEARLSLEGVGEEVVTTKFSDFGNYVDLAIPGDVLKGDADINSEQVEVSKEMIDRNEKRREDLLAIREALEKYYNEKGQYPEAREVEEIDDENSKISKELVSYLNEVPRDPSYPNYFYGYYCVGGEQYKLTGVQEKEEGDAEIVELTQSKGFI